MAERSVVIRLRGDISHFTASMKAAGASATGMLGKQFASVTQNRQAFEQLGRSAGKVGLAAAAGLALVTKAAIDWETAWTGVTKTVDGSESQMASLEVGLRNLATTLPATHAEIAGVAEAAGQLGVSREGIVDFTKTMIDLAETTNLTADEAATSIAQMANVMGTAPDDIDNLGSALVALGNDGASTERDIIQMAQGISGAAAIVGLAEADVLALANATASMGIDVEAGGTSISRVLTDMGKATAQGGPKLEAFAAAAGMSGEAFATAFGDTPAKAFASFIGGLGEITAAGGDVFTVLDTLGLSDVRVSRALLGMASSGALLTDSLALGSKAWEDNTALAIEAAKRYETTAAQTQIAWNEIKDELIDAGDVILPIVRDIAVGAGNVAEAFGALPEPVLKTLVALTGLTAIFGGGLWFTSKVIGSISDTRKAMTDLGVSASGTSRLLKGVGTAAAGLAALTALGVAVDAIRGKFEDSLPGMEEFTRKLLALKTVDGLGDEWDDFGGALEAADGSLAKVGSNIDGVVNALGPAGTGLRAVGDALSGNFTTGALAGHDALAKLEAQTTLVDTAFANLATSTDVDMAASVFKDFAAANNLSADAQKILLNQMPQYQEAIAGAANEATLAAGAQDAYSTSVEGTTAATQAETAALQDAIDAMAEKRDLAIASIDAEVAYAGSLLDVDERLTRRKELLKELAEAETPEDRARIREELEDYTLSLDLNTRAGQANLGLLTSQAAAWNNLPPEVQNAEGAFKAAKDELYDTARQFGATKAEARKFVNTLLDIPERITVRAELKAERAQAELDAFSAAFDGLDGKVAKTFIDTTLRQHGNKLGATNYVTGGEVTGVGTGTSDSIPAMLSNGEHVWTAAEVSAAGGQGAMYEMRRMIRGYATGGAVSFASRPAPAGQSFDAAAIAQQLAGSRGAPLMDNVTFRVNDMREAERYARDKQALVSGGGVAF